MSISDLPPHFLPGEDGYELWLRYVRISDEQRLREFRAWFGSLCVAGSCSTAEVTRRELTHALPRLLDMEVAEQPMDRAQLLVVDRDGLTALPRGAVTLDGADLRAELTQQLHDLGSEGFVILGFRTSDHDGVCVAANTACGALYGSFTLLRLLQTHTAVSEMARSSKPRIQLRMLNHWDNLDRSVERGYAGSSLWDWQHLPDYLAPRYTDYARALASIGLNGTTLVNVNSNARILTREFLSKVEALAGVFRPYGVKVFLTARFSAPVELGELDTADPLAPEVIAWWHAKADEIYRHVPDFGGFVVKANSEGQPGPQDYGRTHADGANLLADALAPHGGVSIWRAFVYDHEVPDDRANQACDEFVPRDGEFRDNVFIQVKNGPIDFQPREPFHPLLGAMPKTPLMLEFQLTQEYLGFASHLVYLATMFQEVLEADTFARGPGSSVGRIVDGSVEGKARSGITAVTNIGTERNWCGHPFAQANWYAFGRLAWDHELGADVIAEEWLRMTFTNDAFFVASAKRLMLESREICVNYMTPLGLHHIMAWSHHFGPGPWIDTGRPDWTSVYYHRADKTGLGFDRTSRGSNNTGQYAAPVREMFENLSSCPEELLLWFHHVPWDHRMRSGRSLWDELCYRYYAGAAAVEAMQRQWDALEAHVDPARFSHVKALLAIQAKEAIWWRDACVLYFQTFAQRDIPADLQPPEHDLEYYRRIVHHYVPGN